jgi:hypothetical protein
VNISATPPTQADALRALLRERFPEAHAPPKEDDRARLETGCRELDAIGIAKGTVTEVVKTRPSSGAALLVSRLVEGSAHKDFPLALIDGRDGFDPAELPPATLQRLLWIRATNTAESVKAADLLLRDGNLPLVTLDLTLSPHGEIARVPDTSWQRLRALAEKTSTVLLALTPGKTIPRPHLRINLAQSYTLTHFEHARCQLTLQLQTTRVMPVMIPLIKSA